MVRLTGTFDVAVSVWAEVGLVDDAGWPVDAGFVWFFLEAVDVDDDAAVRRKS
jgi:hypothetical protein